MKHERPKHFRVLAVAPSYRGFGYAVLDGNSLVDWGVKTVAGDKNGKSLVRIERLIAQYQPDVVVLEDHRSEHSRRSARVRVLIGEISKLASGQDLKVKLFSRKQIAKKLLPDGQGTKDTLAEVLAERFPEELSFRLPPKRKFWKSEDYRINIFDAVALGLMVR